MAGPIRLAVVAPVTLSPSAALFDTDPPARTAAWKDELDPAARIGRILDGTDVDGPAGPVPVTWAVDPGVLGVDLPAGRLGDPSGYPSRQPCAWRSDVCCEPEQPSERLDQRFSWPHGAQHQRN